MKIEVSEKGCKREDPPLFSSKTGRGDCESPRKRAFL